MALLAKLQCLFIIAAPCVNPYKFVKWATGVFIDKWLREMGYQSEYVWF